MLYSRHRVILYKDQMSRHRKYYTVSYVVNKPDASVIRCADVIYYRKAFTCTGKKNRHNTIDMCNNAGCFDSNARDTKKYAWDG